MIGMFYEIRAGSLLIIKFFSSVRLIIELILLCLRLLSNYFAFLFINIEELIIEWELLSLRSTLVRIVFIFDFTLIFDVGNLNLWAFL